MNVNNILAATPYWFGDGSKRPGDAEHDRLPEVVRPLVEDQKWVSGDSDALRSLAYAHHVGALSEDEIRERLLGSDAALVDAAVSSAAATAVPKDDLDTLIDSVLAGHGGSSHVRPKSIAEGWHRAILEMISDLRPAVLPLVLAENPVPPFSLQWLLHRWSGVADEQAYADALLSKSDEQSWRIGAAFLSGVAREHVLHGTAEPQFVGAADANLVAGGLVLTQLAQMRFIPGVFSNPESQARLSAIVESIASMVSGLLKRSENAELVKRSQRDDAALVAILLRKSEGKTLRVLASEGDALLDQYFRMLTRVEPVSQEQSLPYLSAFLLDDLIGIWVSIHANVDRFDSLRQNLRYDEYSYQFTYSHYLIDRRRAIILAAVAAVAAVQMQDDALLEAARSFAAQLHDLPPGVVQPFDDGVLTQLRGVGIDLPPS
jgi:hypothetical protein